MCEQVRHCYLSCAQDVILDSCRETRAELRAKFPIIVPNHELKVLVTVENSPPQTFCFGLLCAASSEHDSKTLQTAKGNPGTQRNQWRTFFFQNPIRFRNATGFPQYAPHECRWTEGRSGVISLA